MTRTGHGWWELSRIRGATIPRTAYYTDADGGNSLNFILCTYRYYDTTQGRWLTRDPIGFDGGINLYAYCGNGPTSGVNGLGLDNVAQDPNALFQYELDHAGVSAHCLDYNGPGGNGDAFASGGQKVENFAGSTCSWSLVRFRKTPQGNTCWSDMPTPGSVLGLSSPRSCASDWSRINHGKLLIINWGHIKALDPEGKYLFPIYEIRTCAGVMNANEADPNYAKDHPDLPPGWTDDP